MTTTSTRVLLPCCQPDAMLPLPMTPMAAAAAAAASVELKRWMCARAAVSVLSFQGGKRPDVAASMRRHLRSQLSRGMFHRRGRWSRTRKGERQTTKYSSTERVRHQSGRAVPIFCRGSQGMVTLLADAPCGPYPLLRNAGGAGSGAKLNLAIMQVFRRLHGRSLFRICFLSSTCLAPILQAQTRHPSHFGGHDKIAHRRLSLEW